MAQVPQLANEASGVQPRRDAKHASEHDQGIVCNPKAGKEEWQLREQKSRVFVHVKGTPPHRKLQAALTGGR